MVLDASKTNIVGKCKSIANVFKTNPREIHTKSLIFPQTNENKSANLSAYRNGFGCIQNQSTDKCKEISLFIAHEKEMQTT
jgi:hypothetical protein